jgi:hypothetical protein
LFAAWTLEQASAILGGQVTANPAVATSPDAARLYAVREQRLNDAIALRTPDRVPIVYFSHFWQRAYDGKTVREIMYDYDAAVDAARSAILDLQPDGVQVPVMNAALGPMLEVSNYGHLRWPGHGVPDDCSYQFIDQEVMKGDEYDLYLADPSYFCLTRYFPRIMPSLNGLSKLPQFGSLAYLDVLFSMVSFTDPEITQAFARMAEIGAEALRIIQRGLALEAELAALGFPSVMAGVTLSPFDYFADCMRGSKGAMLDMFRRQDKLLAAMDCVTPMLRQRAIAMAACSRSKIIFIPLHWGLDGFMSPRQFNTFYWPPLRKLMMGFIERGFVPCPLWEGNCLSRLETIADIPRGKAIYWFERTDLFRAKEVLGDIVCLRGNVPPSLLNTGTPDEVKAYCRALVERVGRDGGLIVDGAIGLSDEARLENVRAMFHAVQSFG